MSFNWGIVSEINLDVINELAEIDFQVPQR